MALRKADTPLSSKFSAENFLRLSQEALNFQLSALYPIKSRVDPARTDLLVLNHDRNFSTFLTIRYLVEHERVADIYTLSRSMFESIVSMGLLARSLVVDDIARYQEFQYVEVCKTYEHLQRLGLENLSGLPTSDVQAAIEKRSDYLKRWGKNQPSWSGRSLEDNVRRIDAAYAGACNESHFYEYLYCQVYRNGSQSTHSSFGGLSKGVTVKTMAAPGITAKRFATNENHLIFSSFHSLLVFLSSVRFMGISVNKNQCETYFQDVAKYIIAGD